MSKKDWLLHRLVYSLCVSAVAASQVVYHRCDNPPCCNPEHLFLGTQSDNLKDAFSKGRIQPPCPKGGRKTNKLTPDSVRNIRRRADAGERIAVLAKEHGVSDVLISQVVHRHRYAWVSDAEEGVA